MSTPDFEQLKVAAERLADELLFPLALDADRSRGVPIKQLDALADAGLYGASAHCSSEQIAELIEIIASGCLTTTFVWTQHLGAVRAALDTEGPVRAELADRLVTGELRAGVAFAHLLRPGEPVMRASACDGGAWRFDGTAPWVTGWGHIDVVHAAARHGDSIVWAMLDATTSPTLRSEAIDFAVVDATQTEVLHFESHPVAAERVTAIDDYQAWRSRYRLGLRTNGSLALGVARRCCALLESAPMVDRLAATRNRLDTAPIDDMAAARAAASLFAVEAATAVVAMVGGRAVMLEQHAQRLMREAMFVLVQGQTPEIKRHLLTSVGAI